MEINLTTLIVAAIGLFVGAIGTGCTVIIYAIRQEGKINRANEKLDSLEEDFKEHYNDHTIHYDTQALDLRFKFVAESISKVETTMEKRFDTLDKKLDKFLGN